MSAFGGKADIIQEKADLKKCPLMTQSGHDCTPSHRNDSAARLLLMISRERLGLEAVVPAEPGEWSMKTLLYGSAALSLLAASATAQNINPSIQPNELTATAKQKPPLQLSDQQRRKIQDALVTAHSAQKTPDKFEAKIGEKVPTALKLDAMPAPLINQEPVLKQYDFVKLDNDLLVVDPMDSTVVAVIPRKFPKEQATQGSAPSGQTHDPASHGDEAETHKKN
jgi:hypothetical protein